MAYAKQTLATANRPAMRIDAIAWSLRSRAVTLHQTAREEGSSGRTAARCWTRLLETLDAISVWTVCFSWPRYCCEARSAPYGSIRHQNREPVAHPSLSG